MGKIYVYPSVSDAELARHELAQERKSVKKGNEDGDAAADEMKKDHLLTISTMDVEEWARGDSKSSKASKGSTEKPKIVIVKEEKVEAEKAKEKASKEKKKKAPRYRRVSQLFPSCDRAKVFFEFSRDRKTVCLILQCQRAVTTSGGDGRGGGLLWTALGWARAKAVRAAAEEALDFRRLVLVPLAQRFRLRRDFVSVNGDGETL